MLFHSSSDAIASDESKVSIAVIDHCLPMYGLE